MMSRMLRLATAALLLSCLLVSTAQARKIYESSTLSLFNTPIEEGHQVRHPVDINPVQLEALLSHIMVQSEETGEQPVPLFPDERALEAATEVQKALRHISRDQELLLIGYRNVGSLLSSTRYASTARVFVQDNHLHLIFHWVDKYWVEFMDRKRVLPPFGTRAGESDEMGGKIVPGAGIQIVNGRRDWIALDLATPIQPSDNRRIGYDNDRVGYSDAPQPAATSAPAPAPAAPQSTTPRYGYGAPAAAGAAAGAAAAGTATPTYQQAPPPGYYQTPQQPYQPTPGLSPEVQHVEQKFELLRRLKEKGWITEEDYERKKKQLLDKL